VYTIEDYFGITGESLAASDAISPNAPTYTKQTGELPTGQRGTVSSFTDWRRSPIFWLAVFGVFALGYIHLESSIRVALK